MVESYKKDRDVIATMHWTESFDKDLYQVLSGQEVAEGDEVEYYTDSLEDTQLW